MAVKSDSAANGTTTAPPTVHGCPDSWISISTSIANRQSSTIRCMAAFEAAGSTLPISATA